MIRDGLSEVIGFEVQGDDLAKYSRIRIPHRGKNKCKGSVSTLGEPRRGPICLEWSEQGGVRQKDLGRLVHAQSCRT